MKKLWMDLELRYDIDDVIALLFALQSEELDLRVVSIHNPCIKELNLLKSILNKYKSDATIIMNGELTEYPDGDIHPSLFKYLDEIEFDIINLDKYIELNSKEYLKEMIYFTGGSLNTLKKVMRKQDEIEAYIQGGYVGPSLLEEKDIIHKFRKRDKVPSWNMNLDLESTREILKNSKSKLTFVSKNICHSSLISLKDIKRDDFISEVLKGYFDINEYKSKCMHDVLCLFSILYPDLIKFKQVDLMESQKNGRSQWYSVENEYSNKRISVSYNYEEFLKKF